MKKIVIVAVNFNTEKDTLELLNSIEEIENNSYSLEIIIVDNGSRVKFVLPRGFKKKVMLIRSEENTGFSGGFNIGIKNALELGADYVLVINNDTILRPMMIENLLKVLENNEKIGIVTPKIYFAKGHEFHKSRYSKEEEVFLNF